MPMTLPRTERAEIVRAPKWIERGAELAMHGIFTGLFIRVLEPVQELESAGKGAWVAFSSAGILCLFALFYLVALGMRRRIPGGLKWWVGLSAPVVWVMLAQGVADFPAIDLVHTMRRGVPWVALVLLPVLGAPEFRPRLRRVLTWHACLGVAVGIWVMAMHWQVVTAEHVVRREGLEAKQGKALLYPIYFLLYEVKALPLFLKAITGAGVVILAIQAVVSATRQAILLLAIALIIGGWAYLRQRALQGRAATFFKTALVVAMVAVVGAYMVPRMTGALALTEGRFAMESGGQSLKENNRWLELRTYFFEQASLKDYIFGRGVNGRWLYPGGGYTETMHIGYGRYSLKGGVVVVLLILFGPVLVGVRTLLRSRSPEVLAAAGMCAWFGVKNFVGKLVDVNPQFFLIMISFGICLFALGGREDGTGITSDTEGGEQEGTIGRRGRMPVAGVPTSLSASRE